MKEAFEKILERLDAKKQYFQKFYEADGKTEEDEYINKATQLAFDDAKNIVQKVAEEYNNGWIACSEKLPELRQDVLVTVKYTRFMGMHGYWIKTGHMEAENDWWGDCTGGEVIAWKPLPQPYTKGE